MSRLGTAAARGPTTGAVSPPGGECAEGDTRARSPMAARRAVDISIAGVVQGVGFRPFVHRLAIRHGVGGWVRNESGAVTVRAEGADEAVDAFVAALPRTLPPLARIDRLEVEEAPAEGLDRFEVAVSLVGGGGRLPVSPDVAMCAACEAELLDPSDRRYRYPFITCTDCGPRFTLIESMPYDRERTTMRVFAQCPKCRAEYEDPSDRRYHSETNSCPECGPSVWLEHGATVQGDEGIRSAGTLLRCGGILAVRGLGGFHLAARADDEAVVARLRRRKGRYAKPLAVMVADLEAARRLARVSEAEASLILSPQRPIVVLERRRDSGLSPSVSPGLGTVGVMIAYTPLHRLLFDGVDGVPLLMTSGNVSDEPIATSNEEARRRLGEIADAFLMHDREIVARYDDSVVRVVDDHPIVIRRSRGYAPMPLTLPVPAPEPILAVGPHLKNTFTLADGPDAFVSQHIGDLESMETLRHFDDARSRLGSLFAIRPRHVVRDLHPGYLSTAIAEESGLEGLEPVQHHHAHVAAVMAEHGVTEAVLGLAFDGTGYGADGRVWGCEALVANLCDFERVAHLRYAPLPGGDRAARAPWRSLLGYASLDGEPDWIGTTLATVDPVEVTLARQQIGRSLNTPFASSLGRLFDAAAALLGIRTISQYEGQAAMELEAAATGVAGRTLPFPVLDGPDGARVLDPVPLLRALATSRASGRSVAECAADFHETVVDTTARLAVGVCGERGLGTVALGGGCFQNALLLRGMTHRLADGGLRVLVARTLGPNDGAVSYGQAAVAAARSARAREVSRAPIR